MSVPGGQPPPYQVPQGQPFNPLQPLPPPPPPPPPPAPPKRASLWRLLGLGCGGLLVLACVFGAIITAANGGGTATATPQSAASNPTPVGTSVAAAANQVTATVAAKAAPTEKPAAPTATPKPPPTATPTPVPPPGLNQIVSVKNWDLAVASVERPGKDLVWSQYGNKSAAAGTWFIVVVDMKNTGNTNFGVNTSDFELNADGGIKYDVSSDYGTTSYGELKGVQRIGGQVPPGVNVRYYVVFDIAPNSTGLTLKFKQDKNPVFAVGNAAP